MKIMKCVLILIGSDFRPKLELGVVVVGLPKNALISLEDDAAADFGGIGG